MHKFHRAFKWLVVVYAVVFVVYLFNLATPPNNMPLFIVMAVVAAAMLIISRDKKRVAIALFSIVAATVLAAKEYKDGVALKERVEKLHQHTQ